jgi:hypothetical protein
MLIALRLANLSRFIIINQDQLKALALKGAVLATFGIAITMTFNGGWGVVKFFLVEAWPIYREMMNTYV